MMLIHGEIVPGERIGKLCLGSPIDDVKKLIIGDYKIKDKNSGMPEYAVRYDMENFTLWFINGVLQQIGVYAGFEDKFGGIIGIGNTLADIQSMYGSVREEYDDWLIEGVTGICFELADNDEEEEWDELKAPICAIYVYN